MAGIQAEAEQIQGKRCMIARRPGKHAEQIASQVILSFHHHGTSTSPPRRLRSAGLEPWNYNSMQQFAPETSTNLSSNPSWENEDVTTISSLQSETTGIGASITSSYYENIAIGEPVAHTRESEQTNPDINQIHETAASATGNEHLHETASPSLQQHIGREVAMSSLQKHAGQEAASSSLQQNTSQEATSSSLQQNTNQETVSSSFQKHTEAEADTRTTNLKIDKTNEFSLAQLRIIYEKALVEDYTEEILRIAESLCYFGGIAANTKEFTMIFGKVGVWRATIDNELKKATFDIAFKYSTDDTVLHYAAALGSIRVVEDLMGSGHDINMKTEQRGFNTLYSATTYRQTEMVKFLLDNGANANASANQVESLLEIAASLDSYDMLEVVLSKGGANAKFVDSTGRSLLEYCAQEGRVNAVKCLLDHSADNADKNFPILLATKAGHLVIVELLLAHGANIEAGLSSEDDLRPLHCAARSGKIGLIKVLLRYGANIDAQDEFSRTPVYFAAEGGHDDALKYLLDHGAKLVYDSTREVGFESFPLGIAAAAGHDSIVKILLDRGADIDARNGRGWNPLHTAICKGSESVAKLLLDRGADIEATESVHLSPLSLVLRDDDQNERLEMVRLLLERGANVGTKDSSGNCVLHYAVRRRLEFVKLLLRYGAVAEVKNDNGETPLFSIVIFRTSSAFEMAGMMAELREHGAQEDTRNKEEQTLLHVAVLHSNQFAVTLLLGRGADPNTKDSSKNTPLHDAVKFHNIEIVSLLLQNGANPDARNGLKGPYLKPHSLASDPYMKKVIEGIFKDHKQTLVSKESSSWKKFVKDIVKDQKQTLVTKTK